MSLESFYGGKQGISPVIKSSFEFIDANDPAYRAAIEARTPTDGTISSRDKDAIDAKTMDLCFSNTSYKNVWYNELCIIDTINKNNPNNGKIFRRTLKGAGDTGTNLCAEYVGRIVGPAGTNPFFSFGSLKSVEEQGKKEKIDLAPEMQVSYPIDENGNISSAKTEIIDGQEVQIDINPFYQSAAIGTNGILVPGKAPNGEYHDDIKYTWLNVVDDTREIPTRSIIYMGFQIPYPSLEINSETIDWWESASIIKNTQIGLENIENHPFYHNWTISIPRGVRGNAATNIRLVQQKEFSNVPGGIENKPILYDFEKDLIESNNGIYVIRNLNPQDNTDHYGPDLPDRTGIENSYIWVYDYIFYDVDQYDDEATESTIEHTKKYTFYLGSYNEISDVILEEDGTLTFIYSDATSKIFSKKISWINDVLIENSGILNFVFNQTEYRLTGDSKPREDKTYYIYNNDTQQYEEETSIGDEFNPEYTYYEYTDTYSKQLPYPTNVIVNDDGTIDFGLAGKDSLRLQDWSGQQDYKLDYVKAINMDDNTKVLYSTTTVNDRTVNLNGTKGINYIEAMTIDDRYHLLVYYASNQYRVTQDDIVSGSKKRPGQNNPISITTDGGNYAYWDNKTFRKGITGYPDIYWQDFGSVLEKSAGVKIYTKVKYKKDYSEDTWPVHPQAAVIDGGEWSSDDFIAGVLNPMYWNDPENPTNTIENPYYEGNIPGENENVNYRGTFLFTDKVSNGSLFFYDYDYKWQNGKIGSWMYAGSMNTSTQVDIKIQQNDDSWLNPAQTLTDYGVILRERATTNWSSLLPNFGV